MTTIIAITMAMVSFNGMPAASRLLVLSLREGMVVSVALMLVNE